MSERWRVNSNLEKHITYRIIPNHFITRLYNIILGLN